MIFDGFGCFTMSLDYREIGSKCQYNSKLQENKELNKTVNGKAGIRTLGTLTSTLP